MTNRIRKSIAILIVASIGLFAIEMYQASTNVSMQAKYETLMQSRRVTAQ